MKEKLEIIVILPNEKEGTLEITHEYDVLEIKIEGVLIAGGDWSANFKPLFERALQIWK